MPAYIGEEINGFWENKHIAYDYKELTTEKILMKTESFKSIIKPYKDEAKKEGQTLKEFYEGLGFCESYKEWRKSSMIQGMITEKKLKMIHMRNKDKFMWILI